MALLPGWHHQLPDSLFQISELLVTYSLCDVTSRDMSWVMSGANSNNLSWKIILKFLSHHYKCHDENYMCTAVVTCARTWESPCSWPPASQHYLSVCIMTCISYLSNRHTLLKFEADRANTFGDTANQSLDPPPPPWSKGVKGETTLT